MKLITEDELRQLGVLKTGHRKRIIHWVESQREGNGSGIVRSELDSDGRESVISKEPREDVKEMAEAEGSSSEIRETNDSKGGKKDSGKTLSQEQTSKASTTGKDHSAIKDKGGKDSKEKEANKEQSASAAPTLLTVPADSQLEKGSVSPRSAAGQQARPNQPMTSSGSSFPTVPVGKKGTPSKGKESEGTSLL